MKVLLLESNFTWQNQAGINPFLQHCFHCVSIPFADFNIYILPAKRPLLPRSSISNPFGPTGTPMHARNLPPRSTPTGTQHKDCVICAGKVGSECLRNTSTWAEGRVQCFQGRWPRFRGRRIQKPGRVVTSTPLLVRYGIVCRRPHVGRETTLPAFQEVILRRLFLWELRVW